LISTIPGATASRSWGTRNVQFSKAPNVLRAMGSTHLTKNEKAIKELAEKGMAPD
jgi:lactoylglutathione lyase